MRADCRLLELAKRAINGNLKQRVALNSTRAVGDYLKLIFAGKEHECFVALFLNMRNQLIATEEMFRGTLNHTTVYPAKWSRRRCGTMPPR
jgi:DNA repair protein RadC